MVKPSIAANNISNGPKQNTVMTVLLWNGLFMNCGDAADCKEVSRDITNLDRIGWAKSAESLCYHGIKAKSSIG